MRAELSCYKFIDDDDENRNMWCTQKTVEGRSFWSDGVASDEVGSTDKLNSFSKLENNTNLQYSDKYIIFFNCKNL